MSVFDLLEERHGREVLFESRSAISFLARHVSEEAKVQSPIDSFNVARPHNPRLAGRERQEVL